MGEGARACLACWRPGAGAGLGWWVVEGGGDVRWRRGDHGRGAGLVGGGGRWRRGDHPRRRGGLCELEAAREGGLGGAWRGRVEGVGGQGVVGGGGGPVAMLPPGRGLRGAGAERASESEMAGSEKGRERGRAGC